jgi:hypothetical protein
MRTFMSMHLSELTRLWSAKRISSLYQGRRPKKPTQFRRQFWRVASLFNEGHLMMPRVMMLVVLVCVTCGLHAQSRRPAIMPGSPTPMCGSSMRSAIPRISAGSAGRVRLASGTGSGIFPTLPAKGSVVRIKQKARRTNQSLDAAYEMRPGNSGQITERGI